MSRSEQELREKIIEVAGRRIAIGGPKPELRNGETLVRNTLSVCPECYRLLPALVYEKDGKIWIRKNCPEHGEVEDLYWGDAEMYRRAMTYEAPPMKVKYAYKQLENPCPFSCGICSIHTTQTALANVVVTNRCNLSCWYCLPRDEEVLFKVGEEVELKKLQDISKNLDFNHKAEVGEFSGEYAIPENLYVLSFSEGKAEWTRVTKIFRRKYEGKLLRIKTRTGREVRVTPEHMFLVNENGEIRKKRADELDESSELILLWNFNSDSSLREVNLLEEFRILSEEDKEKIYVRGVENINVLLLRGKYGNAVYNWKHHCSMPLKYFYDLHPPGNYRLGRDATKHEISSKLEITPEIATLIGYFISDGNYSNKDIRITVAHEDVEKELISILEKLGLPHSFLVYEGKTRQLVVGSRLIRLVFKHVLGIPEKSANKRLPRGFLNFPLESKLALLSGLFNGDGYVVKGSRHLSIGYASVSKNLISDILYLLASLGIFARVHKVSKEKIKGADHDLYKIYIAGKDLVKLVSLIKLRKGHVERLGDIGERKEAKVVKFGDFYLDDIESVREEQYSGYVYDLEVENKSHSFVASDGFLLGNCFFFAERSGYVYEPTLEQYRMMMKHLRKQYPYGSKAIQLTGGEPLMRDDLVDIVRITREEGFSHIQLNTHGIFFALDGGEELARRLREAGVNTVYLSFDGLDPKINVKNHWEIPYIFENFRRGGMTSVVLVPTVINGWNTGELGKIVRFAAVNADIVRGVNFQPVSLVGQMPRKERDKHRVTIPDVIRLVEEQTNGEIGRDAWYPVPFTLVLTMFLEKLTKGKEKWHMPIHPACGMATYVYLDRSKDGIHFVPITSFVDVEGLSEYLREKTAEMEKGRSRYMVMLELVRKLGGFIDKEKQPKDLNLGKILTNIILKRSYGALSIFHYKFNYLGMMHFMDPYNYDVERVMHCGVHYVTPEPNVVPFCTFNVLPELYRDNVQRKLSISLEEWNKLRPGTVGDKAKYKRDVKRLASGETYRKAYEGFL
ncbi:MAG: tetraether lipid synthase Tes [Thermoproteota archaeon]